MKAIGSSNGYYNVFVRGMDNPIRMTDSGGEKLATYLEGTPSMFVHIKDTDGAEYTLRVSTIDRLQKFKPQRSSYKTVEELRMPDLVGDNYEERVWK